MIEYVGQSGVQGQGLLSAMDEWNQKTVRKLNFIARET